MHGLNKKQIIAAAFDDALEEEGFAPEGYTIIGELDRGGMSIVYLAEQQDPLREVALKIILPRYASDEQFRVRFQREGHTMANLDHPGILPVYQVGEWEQLSFIAMKLANGGSLQDLLKQKLPTTKEAVGWLISVGEAIHFAHQSGVLHRDLKPGNLLFDHSGAIYVSDFGIAKSEFNKERDLTVTNTLIGTPHYLAPEVASGELNGGSVSTDLYGLGAILYQCLTGVLPYPDTTSLAAQLRAIVEHDLVKIKKIKPSVPKDLCVICEKALAKKPSDRYPSVSEFIKDLDRWQSGLHILARPISPIEKVWLWSKRYPFVAILSMTLIFTLLTGSIIFVINYKKRGDLLHVSLIERAKSERLVREPSYRNKVLELLSKAGDIKVSERIREEAIATLAQWDISNKKDLSIEWTSETSPPPYDFKETENGLNIINKTTHQSQTIPLSGILRHPPVFSSDGRFVALVRGNRIEIIIYDILQQNTFSTIPLENWPKKIEISSTVDVIKVTLENGASSLLNLRGDILLEDFHQLDHLAKPIGFGLWKRNFLNPTEVKPYGGELSPNEKFIVTTSAIGIHIWDTQKCEAVDLYKTENQVIDAHTDAWWISNDRILVQIPGAQEILQINQTGKIIKKNDLPRVPGTKIKNIFSNGDWLVELRTEDSLTTLELWVNGDSTQPKPYSQKIVTKTINYQDKTIYFDDWILTLPNNDSILKAFVIDQGSRVLALTNNYEIFEWDLDTLAEELNRLDL